AWGSTTTPIRGWCGCIRTGARPGRRRRGWLRLPKSARRIGARGAGKVSIQSKRTASCRISWRPHYRSTNLPSKRIAVAGLGEIGRTVARRLAQGLPGLALAGVATRDNAKAQAWLDREAISCPLISLGVLPDHA